MMNRKLYLSQLLLIKIREYNLIYFLSCFFLEIIEDVTSQLYLRRRKNAILTHNKTKNNQMNKYILIK